MKNFALAAAPLALLLACSNSTEESGSSEAAATDVPTVTTTAAIDVDLSQVRAPRCKILQGSWIAFEFQGRRFLGYAADDFGTCQTKLADLLSVTVRHATIKTERTGETAKWTLDLGQGFVFTASSLSPADDPDITSTILKSGAIKIDLRTDTSDLKCRILQGSWIQFNYRGHQFMTYGADSLPDCETRMAQFRSHPVHQGFLTRSVNANTAKWTLALDSEWEFSSTQVLETRQPVTIDTATELTNVQCHSLMGKYMGFTYQGRGWLSLAPDGVTFNNCEAITAAFNASPTHSGNLMLRNADGAIEHWLLLDVPGAARGWEFLTSEQASP